MEKELKGIKLQRSHLITYIDIQKLMSVKSIIALLLLNLGCIYCYAQNDLPTDSLIEWQRNRLLKESDFKSKVPKDSKSEASTSARISFSSYTISRGKYGFIIKAYFSPYKSWSRPYMDSIILMHEQFHFNIAELVARKMRACIRGVETNNHNIKKYTSSIDSTLNELGILNKRYDRETEHGTLVEQQIEWQKKIDDQLRELKEYELKDGIELYKYRDLIQQKPAADSVKEWQSNKSLKRSDFKMKNPPSASFRSGASTNIIFTMDTLPHGKYRLNTKAYFFPYESWSRQDKSSSLLLHEQVHFNIAELVARKMRACIRGVEIDNNNIDSVIWKILSVKKELEVLGKKHDKETLNGQVKARQLEWQKKIDVQLLATSGFRFLK